MPDLKVLYFTKEHLNYWAKHGKKEYNYERVINFKDLKVKRVAKHIKYPIIHHMLHNDGQVIRCTVEMSDFGGDLLIFDVSLEYFNKLPYVTIEVEEDYEVA